MSRQRHLTESTSPPMTFNVGDLMNLDKLKDGPLVVFWNQDEIIPCNHPLDYGPTPRPKLIHRLMRVRPFRIDVRVAPPTALEPAELQAWGEDIARRLDVPWHNDAKEGDRAIWLPGWVWCKTAAQATGSSRHIFNKLDGLLIGAAQVSAIAASKVRS